MASRAFMLSLIDARTGAGPNDIVLTVNVGYLNGGSQQKQIEVAVLSGDTPTQLKNKVSAEIVAQSPVPGLSTNDVSLIAFVKG